MLVLAFWVVPALADISGKVRVIDGDTIDVGRTRVRLHGIDAPELDQTCLAEDGTAWACGRWVKRRVTERFGRQRANCRTVAKDKYGRAVARCKVQGVDMGRALVRDGLALAYRKYSMDYDLDEKRAAVAGRGVHAGSMMSPAAFRGAQVKGAVPDDPSCVIKGNISGSGERIYHLPGQEHYARTGIRAEQGERWFCSETEARRAGWRKAYR